MFTGLCLAAAAADAHPAHGDKDLLISGVEPPLANVRVLAPAGTMGRLTLEAGGQEVVGLLSDDGTPVFANVELAGRKLIVEVNSAARAERAITQMGEWLGDCVSAPMAEIRTLDQVMADDAARTRRVGLAVWGHATLTSAPARAALAAARRAGVPAVVLASVSPAGHAIAASARPLGWRADEDDGWSMLPAGTPVPARPRRPVVVFDPEAETLKTLLPRRAR